MMKTILSNWSVMRGLRLLIGLLVIVQSVMQKDVLLGVLVTFLLLTAIANIGCCDSNGCTVNNRNRIKEKEIEYEELNNK
ncbi:MAG: hypothetical protein C4329_12730 [Chitinophagaceae bacterium]